MKFISLTLHNNVVVDHYYLVKVVMKMKIPGIFGDDDENHKIDIRHHLWNLQFSTFRLSLDAPFCVYYWQQQSDESRERKFEEIKNLI
jgi:hypothetical protein